MGGSINETATTAGKMSRKATIKTIFLRLIKSIMSFKLSCDSISYLKNENVTFAMGTERRD
jgi:hypothetical protein